MTNQMNKPTKNVLKTLGITSLAVVCLGSGVLYSMNQNKVATADQSLTKQDSERLEKLENHYANMSFNVSIMKDVFEKINTALVEETVLDQDTLDRYTYYMNIYATQPQYVAMENLGTADEGFVILEQLYRLGNYEVPFTITEETIEFNRVIDKPDTFDEVVATVKELAEEKSERLVNHITDDTKKVDNAVKDIAADVDVDKGVASE